MSFEPTTPAAEEFRPRSKPESNDVAEEFLIQFGSVDPGSIVELAANLTIPPVVAIPGRIESASIGTEHELAAVESALTETTVDDVAQSIADTHQHVQELDERVGAMSQRLDNVDNTGVVVNKEITNLRAEVSRFGDEVSRLKAQFSKDLDAVTTNFENQISALRMLITSTKLQRVPPDSGHDANKGKRHEVRVVSDDDAYSPQFRTPDTEGDDVVDVIDTTREEQEHLLRTFGRREHTTQASLVASTSQHQLEAFSSRPLSAVGRKMAEAEMSITAQSEYDSWDLE